ncbi:MAG: DEAD/DEAH box helicase family protein [Akkermansiaceae bacterium]|jgi:type I restriction enzyme R subunit|nr:DEAD/DEAH box helicase family protein [Akkermansiaceae bacterium]
MISNFAFLPPAFNDLAEAARKAEAQVMGDPRAACFHARFALETAVRWLYRHDTSLRMPYDTTLGAMIHDPGFRNLLPEAVFQKARIIQQVGNQAVHEPRPIRQYDALQVVKELHHLCYWLTRTYAPDASREGAAWSDARVPQAVSGEAVVPRKDLERLEEQLEAQARETLKRQQEKDALDSELQALRAQLAEAKAAAEAKPDTHDYTEAETRHYLIDLELKRAGWPLDQKRDKEFEVNGMPNQSGKGYVDDVLWGDDGKPLGIVESKKTTVDARVGQQQAKLYADCLEAMYGQRPLIFYTNGYEIWLWDDVNYPPRRVSGFYKKEELARLILRRGAKKDFGVVPINSVIVERYYAKRAIKSICEHFSKKQRKALLVMATGTGKTRLAIALVDVLQRANWVKRVLFLADRVALVNQAANAFKTHLPDSSPVNLVTEKNTEARVYVCTYPTLMGLIDETDGGTARFGVGHFDLIIIDEAHRSVYQRYREIFRYFDCLLVGLTATPRDQVDRNTYELFDLEQGVPTDAYELDLAVSDGFLVPPQVRQVDLRFPRDGIHYDDLSDEEKAEWEALDWGDNHGDAGAPVAVNAAAINHWLFNTDTVDKVLQHLMEEGLKVEGGDRLGKTIIFARNHDHAKFIEDRFNFHYPEHAGHFARVIDNQAKYPQSLIDDFSQSDKSPYIAISVDMLDTGIDVPEVLNLVFFKPVYSRIKFWQMIGRGTRLCRNLFGPDQDKEHFRIFDFCFNFDFFRENPNGIEGGVGESLGTRLFKSRVRLLAAVQETPTLEASGMLRGSLTRTLHDEVSGMNPDNFLVRAQLQHVERFQNPKAWDSLTESDIHEIEQHLAGLPSQIETDEIESRFFDLTALRMQLAVVEGDPAGFEGNRRKVIEIAASLEEKDAIPAVKEQLEFLRAVQGTEFWEAMDLGALEDLRLRMRGLVQFIDKSKRKIVYTNFKDEVVGVREETGIYMPKMTGNQYAKKVEDYLRTHQDEIAIQRLRTNQPLTPTDLKSLEETLLSIGEDDGERLLASMLQLHEVPTLAHLIRRVVGMDRAAAKNAFASFLEDGSLNSQQMRFVEMIIDQLASRGFIEPSALYEQPFSALHADGPEGLFATKGNVIDGLFQTLEETLPKVVEG